MSVFPFLCYRVMTFNQEYYYTLLVTAETRTQPADAIPVLLLAAYRQQPPTGSCLTCIYHQRKLYGTGLTEQTADGVHHAFPETFEISLVFTYPLAKGSVRI